MTEKKIDASALPSRLYEALSERGHSDESIAVMPLDEMIMEYTAWVLGYRGWGSDILSLARQVERLRA